MRAGLRVGMSRAHAICYGISTPLYTVTILIFLSKHQ